MLFFINYVVFERLREERREIAFRFVTNLRWTVKWKEKSFRFWEDTHLWNGEQWTQKALFFFAVRTKR